MKKIIRTAGMGRRGPLPVKRSKIADWVRRAIAVGEYAAGERLPDRSWFQAKFGANPTSVQCAFDSLKEDGLVRSVSGHGTSVADPLPFKGRYLLFLKGEQKDGGSRFFAEALVAAAKKIARRRKASFDVRYLVEAGVDSVEYAELLGLIRRQRYAGVFVQGASYSRDLDTITNVDNVPIARFEPKSALAQGSQVVALEGIRDFNERSLCCHLEDLRRWGCRKIAIFYPRGVRSVDAESVLPYVRKAGLSLVPEGFHTTDLSFWDVRQFKRLVRLFLSSEGGKAADGVFLRDTVEPLAPPDWPEDPETEITDETKPSDLGITDGAFADAAPDELRKLAKWAKEKGVGFGGRAVNAMAFDADGDPATFFEEAYLLDCEPTEDAVAAAKARFRFDVVVPGEIPTIEGGFNGRVEVFGSPDLKTWTVPAETSQRFFRAKLRR